MSVNQKQQTTTASHALIICNGEQPPRNLARKAAAGVDLIVAADGGANVARNIGIRPDIIIGDLDSITAATRRSFSSSTFIRIRRQDNTDLEKALDFLLERKVRKATILAATGKRLDHTLGNLSVIWKYTSSIDIVLAGDGWTAMPVARKKTIRAKVGTTVSLLPFGECSGITLRGLRYPLTNAKMRIGEIGVSNVVAKSTFSIEVKRGNMLMILLTHLDAFALTASW